MEKAPRSRSRHRCLGDTDMQSLHPTVYDGPIILVPYASAGGGRRIRVHGSHHLLASCRGDSAYALASPRHAEVCAPFGWSTLSPLRTVTVRHLLSPRSFTCWLFTRFAACLPTGSSGRKSTGLPSSTAMTRWGGCCLSTGGAESACPKNTGRTSGRLPFLAQAREAIFACPLLRQLQQFTWVHPTTKPRP